MSSHLENQVREAWEAKRRIWQRQGVLQFHDNDVVFLRTQFKQLIGFVDDENYTHKVLTKFANK